MTDVVFQSNGKRMNSLIKDAWTSGYSYEKFPSRYMYGEKKEYKIQADNIAKCLHDFRWRRILYLIEKALIITGKINKFDSTIDRNFSSSNSIIKTMKNTAQLEGEKDLL